MKNIRKGISISRTRFNTIKENSEEKRTDTDLAKELQNSKYFEAKMVDDQKLYNKKKLETFLENLPKN